MKKQNKLNNLIIDIFKEGMTSFIFGESLYMPVEVRNPKWRWWKVFTKKKCIKLVLRNKFKNYDKKRITKSN